MTRFEQFEVWVLNGDRWEFLASFPDFDVANAVARARSHRVRLLHVTYEEGKPVAQEVLSEIGSTRQED